MLTLNAEGKTGSEAVDFVKDSISKSENAPINKSTISGIKKLNPIAINVRIIADNLENLSNLVSSELPTEKFNCGNNNLVAKIETLLIKVYPSLHFNK